MIRVRIWIWLEDGRILKAIIGKNKKFLRVYDEYDELIFERTGLTNLQVRELEINFLKCCLCEVKRVIPL